MAIITPMSAMALLRFSSRVESATSALMAAETAPAPCSARPRASIATVSAMAASTLPAAITSNPTVMTCLRPNRSDAAP